MVGWRRGPLRFSVTAARPRQAPQPLDGRLLVMLAKDPRAGEPRFQINDGVTGQLIFGIDVDGLKPGAAATLDGSALGFPLESINDIPAGTYSVQALIHKYETFKRADGHTVKMPMDRGEGQQWARAPGNLYSTPQTITIDPKTGGTIAITLDKTIAPLPTPADTKYVKHERIQSERLTKFWGRPMHLGAHVLLPEGWDTHPDASYPLFIYHGHFPADLTNWREQPPDPKLKPDFSARFNWPGYNRTQQEYALAVLQGLDRPELPARDRHRDPARQPVLRRQLRGQLRQHRARTATPSSTSCCRISRRSTAASARAGRDSCTADRPADGKRWARRCSIRTRSTAPTSPVPIRSTSAPSRPSTSTRTRTPTGSTTRGRRRRGPAHRNYLGHVDSMVWEQNRLEEVLGTKTRSGQQWDIWEAVFSPVGPDGYPARIFDKRTGVIDKKVAEYWRENFDLMHILKRDWNKGLGKKLEGKLNIYVGDMDNYYLNNAVYLAEEFLQIDEGSVLRRRHATTAIAPSTAGTAITRGPTRCRACAITRCSSRRASSAC